MISILVNPETNAVRAMMMDDELYLTGGIFVDSIPEGMTMDNASDYDYDGNEFTLNETRCAERLLTLTEEPYKAHQRESLLQKLLSELEMSDSETMEYATLYPIWTIGQAYVSGHILKYGLNADNETQLYRVVQGHTSQADWVPDQTPALYQAIGFTASGIPIWTQPYLYEDAYSIGDEVEHPQGSGDIWVCAQGNVNGLDGLRNTFEPGVWGWTKKG